MFTKFSITKIVQQNKVTCKLCWKEPSLTTIGWSFCKIQPLYPTPRGPILDPALLSLAVWQSWAHSSLCWPMYSGHSTGEATSLHPLGPNLVSAVSTFYPPSPILTVERWGHRQDSAFQGGSPDSNPSTEKLGVAPEDQMTQKNPSKTVQRWIPLTLKQTKLKSNMKRLISKRVLTDDNH